MNLPSQSVPLPPAYYDKYTGGVWFQDAKKAWMRLKEGDFARFLTELGYSRKPTAGEELSTVDRAMMKIQMEQNVDYAGSLAGYEQGLIEMEGKSVLVTDSPKIIQPEAGEYAVLQTMLMNMFGAEQLPYFEAWIKLAYESLSSGNLRPGQAVVMAGPRNSGKSLVQKIVTKILGGRVGHPYLHMSGGTTFNSDLFGSEHLAIDDECGNTEYRSRQKLTAQFKMITAAESQYCHAKGKPALTLTPFWRLTVSVNDNPESLLVLPLIREDLEDKIMLFKIEQHEMPMPTQTNQEREAFWNQLMAELPHWLHHLCEWPVPAEVVGDRYGVTHYHNPELLEAIDALSPELKLLDLLKKHFAHNMEGLRDSRSDCKTIIRPKAEWENTASELESILTNNDTNTQYEARKLFSFANACGYYLERLSRKVPKIVSRARRSNNRRNWRIDYLALRDHGDERRMDELALSS